MAAIVAWRWRDVFLFTARHTGSDDFSTRLFWKSDMSDPHHHIEQLQPLQQRRYCHIDPAVLLRAINDDPASFCALSRTFLDDAPASFALLEQALQERASAAIAQRSHALKSMTLLLGAQQLSMRLQEVESRALAGECDLAGIELGALFAPVLREVRASIADMEQGAGRAEPGAVPG
jgi:HPt (histidine-containing phosphotransfer) domain-containing protein